MQKSWPRRKSEQMDFCTRSEEPEETYGRHFPLQNSSEALIGESRFVAISEVHFCNTNWEQNSALAHSGRLVPLQRDSFMVRCLSVSAISGDALRTHRGNCVCVALISTLSTIHHKDFKCEVPWQLLHVSDFRLWLRMILGTTCLRMKRYNNYLRDCAVAKLAPRWWAPNPM